MPGVADDKLSSATRHLPYYETIKLSEAEFSPIKQEMPSVQSGIHPGSVKNGTQTKNKKRFICSKCSIPPGAFI